MMVAAMYTTKLIGECTPNLGTRTHIQGGVFINTARRHWKRAYKNTERKVQVLCSWRWHCCGHDCSAHVRIDKCLTEGAQSIYFILILILC